MWLFLWLACLPPSPTIAAPPTSPTPRPTAAPAKAPPAHACGRLPGDPLRHNDQGWGNTSCQTIADTWANVPHEHRTCVVDADCVVIGANCFVDTLNQAASKRSEYASQPCADPRSGQCPTRLSTAACRDGCCVIQD